MDREMLTGFAIGGLAMVAARLATRFAQPYLPASIQKYPEIVAGAMGLAGVGLAAAGYRDVGAGVMTVAGALLADDLYVRFGLKTASSGGSSGADMA